MIKKLLAILSVVFFANQASAWELFGLNENTKLGDLVVLEEKYNEITKTLIYYITPPEPAPIGNQYQLIYSRKHGICSVAMYAFSDKPYPYGKTVLPADDFGVALYNDWRRLESILLNKYGKEDNLISTGGDQSDNTHLWQINDKTKQYGFRSIFVKIPLTTNHLNSHLTYLIDLPGCYEGAQKEAAERNAASIGDF